MVVFVSFDISVLFIVSRFSLAFAVFWTLLIFADFPIAVYLFLAHTRTTYVIEDDRLAITNNTLFKKIKVVFYTSIKSVETRQDIFARYLGVEILRVWTSSPQEMNIFGLRLQKPETSLVLETNDAEELKKFLSQKIELKQTTTTL